MNPANRKHSNRCRDCGHKDFDHPGLSRRCRVGACRCRHYRATPATVGGMQASHSPVTREMVHRFARSTARTSFLLLTAFAMFDIFSTYLGVCRYGSVELNPTASALVQSLGGILSYAPLHVAVYALGGWLLWRTVARMRNSNVALLYSLIGVAVVLYLSVIVVSNADVLAYVATDGELRLFGGNVAGDVLGRDAQDVKEAVRVFDRERFCGGRINDLG